MLDLKKKYRTTGGHRVRNLKHTTKLRKNSLVQIDFIEGQVWIVDETNGQFHWDNQAWELDGTHQVYPFLSLEKIVYEENQPKLF